jgi:tetratricopeptide (TPR) repeat protein
LEPSRQAAARALELDPDFADAQANVAWVTYLYDWDWARAERSFRRTRELNPNSVEAHHGLGHVLVLTTGRAAEGLASFQRAREIDPTSPVRNAFEGTVLVMQDRRDEGIARIQRALRINPDFWVAHLFLGKAYLLGGQTEPGLASLQRAAAMSGGSAWTTGPLGYALAQSGRGGEARRVLEELIAKSRSGYVSPAAIALVLVGLGDLEQAFDWLDKAHRVRDTRLVYLQAEHRWAPLRTEPRFVALAKKLALDPAPPRQPLTF